MSTPAKQASRPAKNATKRGATKPPAKSAAKSTRPAKKAALKVVKPPREPKAPKPVKHCLHGCGLTTKGGDFVIGHDAKLKSILQQAYVAGDKTVELGDSPLSGQTPMAIAKQRSWEGYLEAAKTKADEKANRPKRAAKVKTKGGPLEVGGAVEFNYRGNKRTGKVLEVSGDRARVEFDLDGKTETRPFGRESLTTVNAG